MNRNKLEPYVELGVTWVAAIRDLNQDSSIAKFIEDIDGIMEWAKLCNFSNTTHACESIIQCIKSNHFGYNRNPYMVFPDADYHGMKSRISALQSIFRKEAREQEFALLNDSNDDKHFRELPDRLSLTDNQKQFHKEAMFCIRVDALRAAVVMAWQFSFDYVMVWITNDPARTVDLNTELTRNSRFDAIESYEDYIKTKASERVILDSCKEKPLGENLYLPLIQRLKDRNRFAHANDNTLTAAKVRAFCDEICDIVEQLNAK